MVPGTVHIPSVAEIVLDNLANGIVFVDDFCVIRCVNAKSEELLGFRRDSVIGKRLDMLPICTPLYRVLSEKAGSLTSEMSINGMAIAVKTRELKSADGTVSGEITELH